MRKYEFIFTGKYVIPFKYLYEQLTQISISGITLLDTIIIPGCLMQNERKERSGFKTSPPPKCPAVLQTLFLGDYFMFAH